MNFKIGRDRPIYSLVKAMNEDEILKKLSIRNYDFRLVVGRTKVDYDRAKEDENRKKHGYSLESAVYLLERDILPINSKPFITSDPFKESGEVRHMHMGVDDNWLCCVYGDHYAPRRNGKSYIVPSGK